ncbi:MAG: leucyl aminopeptidase, partial [Nitrospirae bacterium]
KLILTGKNTSSIERKALEIQKIVDAVFFARDLINRPSNELGPEQLAEAGLSLKSKRVKVTVYDRKKIESFGMDAFLAVSKGSTREPRLIVVEYNGGRKGPIALVGKSITFDSGGLSLKPSDAMEKMKYDMSGGAAVLGTIKAVSALDLPVKIIGILPATDNMPGGSATKPGDVVKSITGKTIEILNTDAEGRLALADAIGFVRERYKPEAIVDIATLTGACVIALGPEAAALMSNNDRLAEMLVDASSETGERLWRMPLYDDYAEYLKSDIADLKNIGGRAGGLITAGYFLKEFAGDTPWAHIDIASVAWSDKDRFYYTKGPTGFGVRTFVELLRDYRRP